MITPARTTGRASRIQVIFRAPRSASKTAVKTTRLMIQTLAGMTNSYEVHGWQVKPVAGCGGCSTSRASAAGQDQAGEPAETFLPEGAPPRLPPLTPVAHPQKELSC